MFYPTQVYSTLPPVLYSTLVNATLLYSESTHTLLSPTPALLWDSYYTLLYSNVLQLYPTPILLYPDPTANMLLLLLLPDPHSTLYDSIPTGVGSKYAFPERDAHVVLLIYAYTTNPTPLILNYPYTTLHSYFTHTEPLLLILLLYSYPTLPLPLLCRSILFRSGQLGPTPVHSTLCCTTLHHSNTPYAHLP